MTTPAAVHEIRAMMTSNAGRFPAPTACQALSDRLYAEYRDSGGDVALCCCAEAAELMVALLPMQQDGVPFDDVLEQINRLLLAAQR